MEDHNLVAERFREAANGKGSAPTVLEIYRAVIAMRESKLSSVQIAERFGIKASYQRAWVSRVVRCGNISDAVWRLFGEAGVWPSVFALHELACVVSSADQIRAAKKWMKKEPMPRDSNGRIVGSASTIKTIPAERNRARQLGTLETSGTEFDHYLSDRILQNIGRFRTGDLKVIASEE